MIASPSLSGTKMGRMLSFIRAYKRRIVSSLVFAYAAFLLIHPDEEGRAFDLIFFALLRTSGNAYCQSVFLDSPRSRCWRALPSWEVPARLA